MFKYLMMLLLFVSCGYGDVESYHLTANEKEFIKDFEETFGKIPDDQSWDFYDDFIWTRASTLGTKRFFCEDLGTNHSDFDYNDIVFDVTPMGDSTLVTIKALGGTLPIKLFVGNICIGLNDLHKVMKTNHHQANVGLSLKVPEYSEVIPYTIRNLKNFQHVHAYVYKETYWERINFKPNGKVASIIAVPADTQWMREYTNIIFGYPLFYNSGWVNTVNNSYIYVLD